MPQLDTNTQDAFMCPVAHQQAQTSGQTAAAHGCLLEQRRFWQLGLPHQLQRRQSPGTHDMYATWAPICVTNS